MVVERRTGSIRDCRFPDLVELLAPGDLLVINDTRVFPARLVAAKPTGGRVEVLVLSLDRNPAPALFRSSKPLREGQELVFANGERASICGDVIEGRGRIAFARGNAATLVHEIGEVPLPPYVQPQAGADTIYRDRYQTVYAHREGSVAAPTAGLHFVKSDFDRLSARGVHVANVTLHVGPGTFSPIRDKVQDHTMEREFCDIPAATVRAVTDTRQNGGRVVAVGTTTVRALESASARGALEAHLGDADLFIRPGHAFRSVDGLVTNFHLPRSTLLCLVSAFAGGELIRRAYEQAVEQRYRFYSFGDAMLIL